MDDSVIEILSDTREVIDVRSDSNAFVNSSQDRIDVISDSSFSYSKKPDLLDRLAWLSSEDKTEESFSRSPQPREVTKASTPPKTHLKTSQTTPSPLKTQTIISSSPPAQKTQTPEVTPPKVQTPPKVRTSPNVQPSLSTYTLAIPSSPFLDPSPKKTKTKPYQAKKRRILTSDSEEVPTQKKTIASKPTYEFPIILSDPISTSLSSPSKPGKEAPATKSFTARDLKLVNKSVHKREDLLKEMILVVPIKLFDTFDEHFSQTFVHTTIRKNYESLPVISWNRTVNATYNASTDMFIPCSPREVSERVIVFYYKATDLLEKIISKDIAGEIELGREKMTDGGAKHIIVMIEGYDQFLSLLKLLHDKKYNEQVLSRLNNTQQKTTRSGTLEAFKDFSVYEIESMINSLQLELNVNVFPVRTNLEAAEWLLSFTYAISKSLYDKYERNESLSNLGRVKSGTDKKTTFIESLKQFNLMTTPKVEQVHSYYSSLSRIYQRFQNNEDLGTVNGKNLLPPTVNSAMRKVFLSEDPNEKINI